MWHSRPGRRKTKQPEQPTQLEAADIAGDSDGPLFHTAAGKTGGLTGNPMWQQDAYRMIG